jgi:hypothetical protein
MLNVVYLKNPSGLDHYMISNGDINENFMEVVSISKDHLYVMAEDEGKIKGAYEIINIDKKIFKKMKEHAYKGERKNLTSLLTKIHKQNNTNPSKRYPEPRVDESRYSHDPKWLNETKKKLIDYFKNTKPILE